MAALGIGLPAAAATTIPSGVTTYILDPAGNPFTAPAGTTILTSSGPAIYGGTAAAWTVTNQGSLAGQSYGLALKGFATVHNSGAVIGTTAPGIYLGDGGSIANLAGARVIGTTGVHILGSTGRVINSGTIEGTSSELGPLSSGVLLSVGNAAYVGNRVGGTISGHYDGIGIYGSAATPAVIRNAGEIIAHGSAGYGVFLHDTRGTVINLKGGTIYGAETGISFHQGTAGLVDNQGIVIGAGSVAPSYGVILLAGGTVINGSTGNTAALIEGSGVGVYLGTVSGALLNHGTIRTGNGTLETAVRLGDGGTVYNGAHGLITGYTGVRILGAPGTVTNRGSIVATAPGPGTFATGVYLAQGGLVQNKAGGVITGAYDGVFLAGSLAATVINAGRIIAPGTRGYGVSSVDTLSARVENLAGGTIFGEKTGVAFYKGVGTVINYGRGEGSTTAAATIV
jgi:hypothetical protein